MESSRAAAKGLSVGCIPRIGWDMKPDSSTCTSISLAASRILIYTNDCRFHRKD